MVSWRAHFALKDTRNCPEKAMKISHFNPNQSAPSIYIMIELCFFSLFKLKKGLFLTFRMGTSNARNKNLRPLFNTNIPPISGKYGLRNHFWSLESGFLMRKREENDFFSKICNNSILRFTYLKSAQNF